MQYNAGGVMMYGMYVCVGELEICGGRGWARGLQKMKRKNL